jgi:hypothetical protein
MNTQTENLSPISVQDLLRPFDKVEYSPFERSLIEEKAQMRDQIAMLEAEVDKQDKIIKLFAELLFLTCGDK